MGEKKEVKIVGNKYASVVEREKLEVNVMEADRDYKYLNRKNLPVNPNVRRILALMLEISTLRPSFGLAEIISECMVEPMFTGFDLDNFTNLDNLALIERLEFHLAAAIKWHNLHGDS